MPEHTAATVVFVQMGMLKDVVGSRALIWPFAPTVSMSGMPPPFEESSATNAVRTFTLALDVLLSSPAADGVPVRRRSVFPLSSPL